MKGQKIRKLTLIISMLLFPVTIWYFSPALIMAGALEHILTGSFLVFALMLLCSPVLGRVYCGYLCPGGGIQECAMLVNDKQPEQGWRNNVKYIIWIIWMAAVIICFIIGKNNVTIDPFYQTDHGISVASIEHYVIYYGIVLLLFVPAVLFGKRVACHYYCWMAPFMVIGSKIGRRLHLPQLHVRAEKEKCISCKLCNKSCPMSLDVESMVKTGVCGSAECIQCGACAAACPKKVLHYSMKSVKKTRS